MSMSKKDFVALADAVRPYINSPERFVDQENVQDALVAFCRTQNERFDRDRWLSYLRGECGPSGGKR